MSTLLELQPAQTLDFSETSSVAQTKRLTLLNKSPGFVAFKVKTTAPKCYLVRPSSGVLSTGKSVEIQIILQPNSYNPAEGKPNHRFLVQAHEVDDETPPSRELWNSFTKEKLEEQRLNVKFIDGDTSGVGPQQDSSSMYTSGTKMDVGQTQNASMNPMTTGGNAANSGDLKAKYDELIEYATSLETTNKKLKAELAQKSTAANTVTSTGYQLWQVILVAILSFLATYFSKILG